MKEAVEESHSRGVESNHATNEDLLELPQHNVDEEVVVDETWRMVMVGWSC